jgi:hypothetical protein
MTRFVCLALLAAVVALPAAAVADSGSDYVKYAKVRDRVQACVLDHQWHQLSADRRAQCKSYRKLYELWSQPGESSDFHLHCLTAKKCPPTPNGEPDPRSAIPSGAHVFKP